MYNVTPWTFGSSKDSTVSVSLKKRPEPAISPIVRLEDAADASPPGRMGDRAEERRRMDPSVVARAFLAMSLVSS